MARSNYDRAVSAAAWCRENGIPEEEALNRIQGMIYYDAPTSPAPGALAKRIWETGA